MAFFEKVLLLFVCQMNYNDKQATGDRKSQNRKKEIYD